MKLVLVLKNTRLNNDTGLYEVTEASSKYQIDPSLIDDLGNFLSTTGMLIADWHRGLDEKDQAKVIKGSVYEKKYK